MCAHRGQQVMQDRLILRDRLPGPLSCSTHTQAVRLVCQSHRRDVNVTEVDTKRGQGSAPIVTVTDWWVDRRAPAATPDHVAGREFLLNNQSCTPSIHFLSLSYRHKQCDGSTWIYQHMSLWLCISWHLTATFSLFWPHLFILKFRMFIVSEIRMRR